jgi:hypothetical protein
LDRNAPDAGLVIVRHPLRDLGNTYNVSFWMTEKFS